MGGAGNWAEKYEGFGRVRTRPAAILKAEVTRVKKPFSLVLALNTGRVCHLCPVLWAPFHIGRSDSVGYSLNWADAA